MIPDSAARCVEWALWLREVEAERPSLDIAVSFLRNRGRKDRVMGMPLIPRVPPACAALLADRLPEKRRRDEGGAYCTSY